jgi:hypothetical protein
MKIPSPRNLPFLLLVIVSLSGCAWLTSHQSQITATAQDITPLVESFAADGQLNYAQAIPVALSSIAVWAPSTKVLTGSLSTEISTAVTTFTNGTAKTTGQKIAAALTDGLPAVITGAQAVALMTQATVQASNGAQAVATAAPATSGTTAMDPLNQVYNLSSSTEARPSCCGVDFKRSAYALQTIGSNAGRMRSGPPSVKRQSRSRDRTTQNLSINLSGDKRRGCLPALAHESERRAVSAQNLCISQAAIQNASSASEAFTGLTISGAPGQSLGLMQLSMLRQPPRRAVFEI